LKKAIVIGSGFAGLSSAAYLAKAGVEVTVIEKNEYLGGRARKFKASGYTFDMGPSWYWMPEIFDNFFGDFDFTTKDFYDLIKLDPGFKIVFQESTMEIPANWEEICLLFDKYEKNGAKRLNSFMDDAEKKYSIGLRFLYNSPGLSLSELLRKDVLFNANKLQLLTTYRKHIRRFFSNEKLISLLEFPVLFLGTSAKSAPALYSLMAYSGIKQGTFYPIGGFARVIESMVEICKKNGVKFLTKEQVKKINISKNFATSVTTINQELEADFIIGAADYAHVESKLLDQKFRNYSSSYWESREFSPSALLFYIGVDKKLKKLEHHTLFFDEDIEQHTTEIYETKVWPKRPLFYTCCPAKTEEKLAPKGKENLFILIPIAAGMKDTEELREKYFQITLKRLENYCQQKIVNNIEYKKSYCIKNFEEDYFAFKGNAYGLANTLLQTANLKPRIQNKKVKNLFYTGQLTVPGPGVPPSIISGQLVAEEIIKLLAKK